MNVWGNRKFVIPLLYAIYGVSSCAWPQYTSPWKVRIWDTTCIPLHLQIETCLYHTLSVGFALAPCLINRNIAGKSKLVQLFSQSIRQFLTKMMMTITYNPRMSFLIIYSRETVYRMHSSFVYNKKTGTKKKKPLEIT